MSKIFWAMLLHFYQPPVQTPEVLRKVVAESYRPLIEVLRQHSHARVTVNINGVLTEMLYESGYQDVIDGLRELALAGQLEFVGSAKYHAILPLLNADEQRRQIQHNHLTNKHFLGDAYQPRGFFPPEMCFDRSFLDAAINAGHEWVMASGIGCPVDWPTDVVYRARSMGGKDIRVVFRDDVLSNKIAFGELDGRAFTDHLWETQSGGGDKYIVTALDAETFGHHIENWDQLFLDAAYASLAAPAPTVADQIVTVQVSELLERFPPGKVVEPIPSSWSTTREDLDAGAPYPLWQAPANQIHELQWEHVAICTDLVDRAQHLADTAVSKRHAEIARALLDPALHSCQFWWASRRPHWDINMISRGLAQQDDVVLNAMRAINLSGAPESDKREALDRAIAANNLRTKIRDHLFQD